ncbi:MAG: 3'(2'),5'-bisphosphate nucleotidase CysQ [Candidatus Marinimicrobia bacterium]|nr:3'(2'),5'-bisphosphate nucleotidase CysQ [Candidatus Neomarinimicrobiota bacterium]
MDDELKTAKEAALRAGEILLKYYGRSYEIREKSKDNPVTTADFEADDFLRNTLLGSFPDYGWLSEETKDSPERLCKERVWVVDPLDGTKEFIKGIPEFVVSIGLVENCRPVLGVIYNPVKDEMFTAVKGKQTTLNSIPISCTNCQLLSEASIFASRTETKDGLWKPYKKFFRKSIECGSIAYKLAKTAAGNADLFISLKPKNEWDICAGDFIVECAGGKVFTRKGEVIRYNSRNTFVPNGIIAGSLGLVQNAILLFK